MTFQRIEILIKPGATLLTNLTKYTLIEHICQAINYNYRHLLSIPGHFLKELRNLTIFLAPIVNLLNFHKIKLVAIILNYTKLAKT
jgi:hypothetical protein